MARTIGNVKTVQTGVTRSNAMIFEYRISQIGKTKKSKEATARNEDEFEVESGMTTATKKLFKPEDLVELDTKIRNIREFINVHTMAWGFGNSRLLPSMKYSSFKSKLDDMLIELDALVKEKADKLDILIANAKQSLGKLFDPTNYTTPDRFRAAYKVRYGVREIPSGDDFRVTENLNPADIAQIKSDIENEVRENYAEVLKEPWNRLYEIISEFVEDLKAGKKPQDVRIDHILDLAELLPTLNIGKDPNLDRTCKLVQSQLSAFDMKAIRKDDEERKEAVETLDTIMKKMEGFMSF